jgi:hypothetical protein
MDDRELRRQLLNCIDGTLEAAMYDALGTKINTSAETDMMEELGKLAVNEQFTVEEITAVVENMYMISKEIPVKQPTAHRSQAHSSQAHSSLAKQTPARFENPALAQTLVKQGHHWGDTQGQPKPASWGGTEKICLYTIPERRQAQDLAPKDQQETWHQKTSTNTTEEAQQTLAEEKILDSIHTMRADIISTRVRPIPVNIGFTDTDTDTGIGKMPE